jgi:hypothetical protein
MPVIDPKGLFEGQRLSSCSDQAQLYWPRIYCATNGYGRLEFHAPSIISRCFHYFRKIPTEDELLAVITEFVKNYLAIPYQFNGQLWLQFATEEKFLRRRKTADDENSPAPPPESLSTFAAGYSAWKAEHQVTINEGDTQISEMFPKYFGKVSATFPPGVGVGVGDGDGDGEGLKTFAPSDKKPRSVPEEPTVFDLPLPGKKKEHYGVPQKLYDEYVEAYPGVSVMAELAKMRAWLMSNPTRMKTLRGMPRFMNDWLSKEQNKSHGVSPVGKAGGNLAEMPPAEKEQVVAAEMIATRVKHETGIVSDHAFRVLCDAARRDLSLGFTPDDIAIQMVAMWHKLQENRQNLEHTWGAEAFFGQAYWRTSKGWPWKEGKRPKASIPTND